MPQSSDLYSFGPYLLDTDARCLTRDGEPVSTTTRHFELLVVLVSHAGQLVTHAVLLDAAWGGVFVTANSLEQATSILNKALTLPSGQRCIKNERRRGYRFTADVTRVPRESGLSIDELLAPHRAFLEGRAALETLERHAIVRARAVFDDVIRGRRNRRRRSSAWRMRVRCSSR